MKHDPALSSQAAARDALIRHLEAAVDIADRTGERDALGQALCAALDTVAGGMPRFDAFGNMRADAEFWADSATPAELEIYTAAALRSIQRKAFAERARKRIFWAFWQEMKAEDRAAFLAKVAPS